MATCQRLTLDRERLREERARLITLARRLRETQRDFFRGRGREALEAANRVEREMDEYLELRERPLLAARENIDA